MRALVRGLASTFATAICSGAPAEPISLELARRQHQAYIDLLCRLLPGGVVELPADDRHPGGCWTWAHAVWSKAVVPPDAPGYAGRAAAVGRSGHVVSNRPRCMLSQVLHGNPRLSADCCFIEDTAVVAGRTAVITRFGAPSRQGEEAAVAATLAELGYAVAHLAPPATLDGGDVLQLPGSTHLLVGLSKRTNAAGLAQLAAALPGRAVHGVPLPRGLHLKSLLTALDGATLLFADTPAGRALSASLAAHPALAGPPDGPDPPPSWRHVFVPDPVCANVLLLSGGRVVTQGSDAATEGLLDALCAQRGLQLHRLPRATEFIKADGALTCCSILLPDDA